MGETAGRIGYQRLTKERRTTREVLSTLCDLALMAAVIVTLGGFLGAALAGIFGAFGA